MSTKQWLQATLMTLVALACFQWSPAVLAQENRIIESKPIPMKQPDPRLVEHLQQQWNDFPLIDHKNRVPEDAGETVLTQDGRVSTDGWQRLIINKTPIIFEAKRYSGVRLKTNADDKRFLHVVFRKFKLAHYEWFIMRQNGSMKNFPYYLSMVHTHPNNDPLNYMFLPGSELQDNTEYLIVFMLDSPDPQELAIQYKFARDENYIHINAHAFGKHINQKFHELSYATPPEREEPVTRPATGLVLATSRNGITYVSGVVPGSPADEAGLKPGDKLMTFAGGYHREMSNKALRDNELNWSFEHDDPRQPQLKFTFERPGVEKHLDVTLKIELTRIDDLRKIRNSFTHLKYMAMSGDIDLMHEVGMKLLENKPEYGKPEEAVEFFEMAGKKEHWPSVIQLARMYDQGLGVPQDHKKAFEIYAYLGKQYAIPRFHHEAMFELGLHYDKGIGTEPDADKAINAYNEAAMRGHAQAAFNMGVLNLTDRPKHGPLELQAVVNFNNAHRHGHPEGAFRAGQIFANRKSPEWRQQALDYYHKAVEIGHAGAMVEIGKHYELGRGVEKDDAQAAQWYAKAWELKNPEAALRLSILYQQGRGVEADADKAYELLEAAVAGGKTAIINPPMEEPKKSSTTRRIRRSGATR